MSGIISPFLADWTRLGAAIETIDGVATAMDFGDPAAEVRRVRGSVGFTDLSHFGRLSITGKDRVRFLHGQTTANVKALTAGQGLRAAQLLPNGKMNADVMILADDDRLITAAVAAAHLPFAERLKKFIIMDDVKIEDVSAAYAVLLVAGPETANVLAALTGERFDALLPYHHRRSTIGGHPVRIVGAAQTGEHGAEIWIDAVNAAALFAAIESQGLAPFGARALDVLRIEAGRGVFGRDMTNDHLPVEAGLEHAISYTKGCYVGQEIIARLKTYGQAPRRLAGLSAETAIPVGATVTDEKGLAVGVVSSVAYSPTLDRFVALAILRREAASATGPLTAKTLDRSIAMKVTPLPMVPSRYEPEIPV